MALTIAAAFPPDDSPTGVRTVTFNVTFDNSYQTGGMTCDVSSWFAGSPRVAGQGGDDGYVVQHDRGTAAAGKLLLYEAGADAAALDEVANTTDTSAVICTVTFTGLKALS